MVEQPLAVTIDVTQLIGLYSVRQHTKQQMPRQVRGRSPTEHTAPAGLQCGQVEIAQPRDFGVDGLSVRQSRPDLELRHNGQRELLLAGRCAELPVRAAVT